MSKKRKEQEGNESEPGNKPQESDEPKRSDTDRPPRRMVVRAAEEPPSGDVTRAQVASARVLNRAGAATVRQLPPRVQVGPGAGPRIRQLGEASTPPAKPVGGRR